MALRDFAGQWLEAKAELAAKTTELYEYLLSRLILPGLGDVKLAGRSQRRSGSRVAGEAITRAAGSDDGP